MKKTIFKLLLFGALFMTNFAVSQAPDICDYIFLSHKWPSKFDDYQIQFYAEVPYLASDVEPNGVVVEGGEEGKYGTQYVLELFDENDNLISSVVKKPSEYNSKNGRKYVYSINKNIKEYHRVYLKFTERIYSTIMDVGFIYRQRIDDESCKNVKVSGGADSPNNDRPNLTLKDFKIKKGSTTWDLMKGQKPLLKKDINNPYEFIVAIENNGKVVANNVIAWLGTSPGNNYPSPNTPAYGIHSSNFGTINAGSSKSLTRYVLVSNNIGASPALKNGDTYYLIIDIDPDGKINESNENDNIWRFPITYYGDSPRPGNPGDPIGFDPVHKISSNTQMSQPYQVQVYNIHGRKILTKKVESQRGEEEIIDQLSNGYYILKSENGDRKIAKGQ